MSSFAKYFNCLSFGKHVDITSIFPIEFVFSTYGIVDNNNNIRYILNTLSHTNNFTITFLFSVQKNQMMERKSLYSIVFVPCHSILIYVICILFIFLRFFLSSFLLTDVNSLSHNRNTIQLLTHQIAIILNVHIMEK